MKIKTESIVFGALTIFSAFFLVLSLSFKQDFPPAAGAELTYVTIVSFVIWIVSLVINGKSYIIQMLTVAAVIGLFLRFTPGTHLTLSPIVVWGNIILIFIGAALSIIGKVKSK